MKHLQPSNPLEKKGQDSDRLTTAEELLRTGTDAGKAALAAHRAGLSVIPPKPNGKAPILATWKEFQERRATLEELATWYADGLNGIGVVCGRVSGNLMALDFDDIQAYHDLKELTKTAGLEELVARIEAGYLESTPRGGRHWLWRCSQVRGNEKLASRPTRQDDSFTGHKTLIETRGEGGYVVVSPSTGSIDGRPATYERLSGLFRTIVEISPEDQETLLRLSRTLDEVGPSPYKEQETTYYAGTERPGDKFNRETKAGDLLSKHGWTYLYSRNGTDYWRRPGKTEGLSATTNHNGHNAAWVFSTSTGLPSDQYLSPFALLTFLEHSGDFSSAARALASTLPSTIPSRKADSDEDLLRLALEHYTPGVTPEKETFLVPKSGPRVARLMRIQERELKAELTRIFLKKYGRVPKVNQVADAIRGLEGLALQTQPTELHLRSAKVGQEIWLDLAQPSGKVVRIDADGWSMEDRAPVVFQHTELTGTIVTPEAGELDAFRPLLNLTENGWDLVRGWLVSALHPNIPHPVLILTGPQGTAKSTCARMLSLLIDPSSAPLRTAPTSQKDWAAVAAGTSVMVMDNMSGIPLWLSDAICRAVTGDGYVARELYTDAGIFVRSFKRTLILTGINLGRINSDLLERSVMLELAPISGEQRKLDSWLSAEFERRRAGILGGLLDEVAASLRYIGTSRCSTRPRMADHAQVLSALDEAHGTDLTTAYLCACQDTMRRPLYSDEVGRAIVKLLEEHETWQGSMTDLLRALQSNGISTGQLTTAEALSARIKRLSSQLGAEGVVVERGGNGHGRWVRLSRREGTRDLRKAS